MPAPRVGWDQYEDMMRVVSGNAAIAPGSLWAHPCGCMTNYSGLDWCQHWNRYQHTEPPQRPSLLRRLVGRG